MIRLLAVFLVVWGQLVAGCLQGNTVLCVHADGSTAIELASALCCDVDLDCSESLATECCGDSQEDGAENAGAGDCCQDFLLKRPQLTISPSDAVPDNEHHETARATVTALPSTLTTATPTIRSPLVGDRGPPGPDIVRRCLRSVRLRC